MLKKDEKDSRQQDFTKIFKIQFSSFLSDPLTAWGRADDEKLSLLTTTRL